MTDRPDRKPNATERRAEAEMILMLAEMRREMREMELRDEIPEEWHRVETDFPCVAPREKLTLTLDREVVRFYRAMGRGYQARMNAVLRTWMLARKAKVIRGEGDEDVRGALI